MEHDDYMKLAVQLARTATGQTSPNPIVGAVCVADGQVVGTGFHMKAGTPHAEVHALRMAGKLAEGADLYVTLEPCAHTGKTPPCTEAIIASGIRRVFVASIDPNPAVSGKGIGLLQDAGIEVTMIPNEEADFSNRAFFHYIQHQKPYVTLKAAATLDGRLATQHGDSKWITSEQARLDVHYLRHTHDAILVGVQTILQDNPFLTTRLPHGGKNPIRIILDRRLRTPKSAHVITDSASQTILFTLESAQGIDAFREFPLVRVETIAEHADFLEEVLSRLAKIGVMTLLVEGGSHVHSSFIDQGLADELYLYMAPKFIGNGPSLFENNGRTSISESEIVQILSAKQIGTDIRLHALFSKEVSSPCLLGS